MQYARNYIQSNRASRDTFHVIGLNRDSDFQELIYNSENESAGREVSPGNERSTERII